VALAANWKRSCRHIETQRSALHLIVRKQEHALDNQIASLLSTTKQHRLGAPNNVTTFGFGSHYLLTSYSNALRVRNPHNTPDLPRPSGQGVQIATL
jgi:hypothetical protein